MNTTALQALIDTQVAYQAELKKISQGSFKDFFSTWLAENPKIEFVRWHQYTPHFNDGDPCKFSVSDLYFALVDRETIPDHDGEESSGERGDGFFTHFELSAQEKSDWCKVPRPAIVATEPLDELADTMNDLYDALKISFGDGVQVTVSREEIVIDYYDHD